MLGTHLPHALGREVWWLTKGCELRGVITRELPARSPLAGVRPSGNERAAGLSRLLVNLKFGFCQRNLAWGIGGERWASREVSAGCGCSLEIHRLWFLETCGCENRRRVGLNQPHPRHLFQSENVYCQVPIIRQSSTGFPHTLILKLLTVRLPRSCSFN